MAELAKLKKVKGILKRNHTRFDKFLEKPNELVNQMDIKVRNEQLVADYKEFLVTQAAIENLEDINLDEQERDAFEDKYFELHSKFESRLNITITKQDRVSQNINLSQQDSFAKIVNLPILKIEPFSGDYLKWVEFKSTFDSTIHKRENLSKVDKLNYLKSLLKGEA